MRHRLFATALASALIASSACSLVFAQPVTTLDKTASGTYALEKTHANVLFSLSHLGFSNYYGRFNNLDGALVFDAKDPTKSKLNITVDIASIDTNNAKLEGELKDPKWFDAAKFPTATFASTHVEKLSATTGKVYGDLTLHGVTKPVVLDVVFNGSGDNPISHDAMLGFSAKAEIKRSDFGISQYVPMVGDKVTLTIEAEFQYKK